MNTIIGKITNFIFKCRKFIQCKYCRFLSTRNLYAASYFSVHIIKCDFSVLNWGRIYEFNSISVKLCKKLKSCIQIRTFFLGYNHWSLEKCCFSFEVILTKQILGTNAKNFSYKMSILG